MFVTRIDQLKFPEQFLLWACRQWALAPVGQPGAPDLVSAAFQRLGIMSAADQLHELLSALVHGCKLEPEISPPCSVQLSHDERSLLGLFADLQQHNEADAAIKLQAWCTPTALRVCLCNSIALAASFTDAGLRFRPLLDPAPPELRRTAATSPVWSIRLQ